MTKEKVTFSKWDIVDSLKTEEDIREYLNIAAESGDTRKIARALGDVARARNMSQARSRYEADAAGSLEGAVRRRQPEARYRRQSACYARSEVGVHSR